MELIERCNETLNKLYRFSTEILYLGGAIPDDRLEKLEIKIGYELPEEFKYILKKHNGITLAGTEIYGLAGELKGNSLDMIYKFEHTEVEYPMPNNFLPFSPDGQGNHYCLNMSKLKNGQCPVVFWQWDFDYERIEDVEVCNDNFVDWIDEVMIEWTSQTFNYDGSEK